MPTRVFRIFRPRRRGLAPAGRGYRFLTVKLDLVDSSRLRHLAPGSLPRAYPRAEAADILRGLVEEIRLVPEADGTAVELTGDLARLLGFVSGAGNDKRPGAGLSGRSMKLVAGGVKAPRVDGGPAGRWSSVRIRSCKPNRLSSSSNIRPS